jgi:uncharacterized protein YjcR
VRPVTREEFDELRAAVFAGGGERVLYLPELAERVGVSRETLRTWIKRDRFFVRSLVWKNGGRWASSPARIERWRHRVAAQALEEVS